MSKHVMAVASYYKLMKNGKSFTLDHKEQLEARVLVPRKHIEKINANYQDTGKYYIIDEEATDETYAEGEAKVKKVKEAKAKKARMVDAMTDLVDEANKSAGATEAPEIDAELEDARAKLKELTGKKTYHGWDLDTINEKIAEAEADE